MRKSHGWLDGKMDEEGRDSRQAPWEIGLSSMVPGSPAVTEPQVQIQKKENLSKQTHALLIHA